MILLNNRGVVKLSGNDVKTFLQGLITNDINKLTPQNLLYTAILTPQGKYLFDFIIHENPLPNPPPQGEGTYSAPLPVGVNLPNPPPLREGVGGGLFLDVESSRIPDLIKKLTMYKLRADVKIEDFSNEYKVYSDSEKGLLDPRNTQLGKRLLTNQPQTTSNNLQDYERLRISLAVPENGDLIPEKSFIMQNSFEELNGVDFKKGCYVGQEVTARTKYKGGVKKRLYPVKGEDLPNSGEEIKLNDIVIGEMRSRIANLGIAHLDIEKADGYLAKL
jgi:folate-binding protein YgfZ